MSSYALFASTRFGKYIFLIKMYFRKTVINASLERIFFLGCLYLIFSRLFHERINLSPNNMGVIKAYKN